MFLFFILLFAKATGESQRTVHRPLQLRRGPTPLCWWGTLLGPLPLPWGSGQPLKNLNLSPQIVSGTCCLCAKLLVSY